MNQIKRREEKRESIKHCSIATGENPIADKYLQLLVLVFSLYIRGGAGAGGGVLRLNSTYFIIIV